MELKDLVGRHFLSGVDLVSEDIPSKWTFEAGETYHGETLTFVLDGVTYTAFQDDDDGYRSSMRDIEKSERAVKNTFPGEEVIGRMKEPESDSYVTSCTILELISVVTGKTVLSVGTDNDDDYYPSWVGYFEPKNLSANADLPQKG